MLGRRFSVVLSARASILRNVTPVRYFSLPAHKVIPMPSLSPTMETGSISKWNINVGDRFEPGTSLCDVETDKATVSFDATDEGYLAKILISSGEIKVGQPLLITVEEKEHVAAFGNYQLQAETKAAPTPVPAAPKPQLPAPQVAQQQISHNSSKPSDRIFASPLAKKLIRESQQNLENISRVLGGSGSGPNGRIIASDVKKALDAASREPVSAPQPQSSSPTQAVESHASAFPAHASGPYRDFEVSDIAKALINRQTFSKQTVPHYHVSVEINLKELINLRTRLNSRIVSKTNEPLSVLDFVVKAAGQAMHQVPDINASWMDTFVRRYEQVDINLVMGSGEQIATPVLKDVTAKGLSSISKEIIKAEKALFEGEAEEVAKFISDATSLGTFSIYNLGIYGVKAAAPIVLTPQAASLSIGAIVDTVVPVVSDEPDSKTWDVAPVMVATLSCDHRVVDGATSAQWLAAFKNLLESPENLLL